MLQFVDQGICYGRLAKQRYFSGRCLSGFGLRLRLHGPFAIIIKTAPGLFAEETGIDQFLLDQRGQEALIVVESTPDGIGHGEIDVVADHVHQLERPHAETASFAHDGIDGRVIGCAFLCQAQRLGVVGAGNAIDDETGG